ncbi:MAG: shikimate kinase [Lachnospiraceae bacterium]|nr:shikimate kinase [Lachnospiraceae bacterium]
MNNITLLGMPGAGKSTIGVLLAKALGYDFLDTDLSIQNREGMLLREIIAEKGLEEFKKIEESVNASVDVKKTVIAPGGSVIYGEKAMRHLASISKVVYLELSYEELQRRLGDLTKRGVAFEEGQTLKDLYEERIPLYKKYADVLIHTDHLDIGEVLEKVLQNL